MVGEALHLLHELDIEGVELGSNHRWQENIYQEVRQHWRGALLVHNFFPPANEEGLVVNLASGNEVVLEKSLNHAKSCIDFTVEIGADLYTVHPGFLADVSCTSQLRNARCYDFTFMGQRQAYEEAFSRMLDSIRHLVGYAEKRGCHLAVETAGSMKEQGVLLLELPEECERLFSEIPQGIGLNFNLAHTCLASKAHGFSVTDFIDRYGDRFLAVELSHNDGVLDQHLPLMADSFVFDYLDLLPDVPWILEFRDATLDEVKKSIHLVREHGN